MKQLLYLLQLVLIFSASNCSKDDLGFESEQNNAIVFSGIDSITTSQSGVITLYWKAAVPADAVNYEIYFSKDVSEDQFAGDGEQESLGLVNSRPINLFTNDPKPERPENSILLKRLDQGATSFDVDLTMEASQRHSFEVIAVLNDVPMTNGGTTLIVEPLDTSSTTFGGCTAKAISQTQAEISFEPPPGLKTIIIKRNGVPVGAVTDATKKSHIDQGLTPGQFYQYQCEAQFADGNTVQGTDSGEITTPGGTENADLPPLVFAGVESGEATAHDRVSLTIAPAKGGTGNYTYRVYNNGNVSEPFSAFEGQALTVDSTGKIKLTLENLFANTTYVFMVRVNDGNTEDKNDASVTITTPLDPNAALVPEAPVFNGLVTAQIQSDLSVRLAWQRATDNKTPAANLNYKIFRSSTSLGYDYDTALAETKDNTYVDTAPVLNQLNYYLVRAYDSDGNNDGNFIEKSVPVYAPIIFAGVSSGFAVSDKKIVLRSPRASGGSGQFSYKIYRDGDFSSPYVTLGDAGLEADGFLHHQVTGLKAGTTYSFAIRIFDEYSETSNTESVTVTTLGYAPPTFDGLATAVPMAGVAGKSGLKLDWSPATAAGSGTIDSYQIYVREVGSTPDFSAPAQTVAGSVTTTNVTSLKKATSYYIAVRATDDSGNQEQNQREILATTNGDQPIIFSGANSANPAPGLAGFNTVDLYWSAASGDFDQYHVFVSTTDLATVAAGDAIWNSPTATYGPETVSASINGLTASTKYYIVVRAHLVADGTNDGNRLPVSVTTQASLPVFAGASGISQPVGTTGLTQLTISWSAATGAFNKYQIFKKVAGGSFDYNSPVGTIAAPATSYTATGLTTGTQYCFVVRAVYDVVTPIHTETNTTQVCATPQFTAPTFSGLEGCLDPGSGNGVTAIDLTWTAASGIYDEYAIWQATTAGGIDFNAAPTYVIDESLVSYRINSLIPDTTYFFAARARYSPNSGVDSNTVIVSCKTSKAYLSFDEITNGHKAGNNAFLGNTKVCVKDASGNLANISSSITIALDSGAGTLGGATNQTTNSSCATFTNLTYDSNDTIILRATAANSVAIDSNAITIVTPGTPPGACSTDDDDWFTAYGGCYSPATGLVVSSKSSGTVSFNSVIWESDASFTGVDLHDWQWDGDSDGRPDDLGSDSINETVVSTSAYCHDLSEGGYVDWRIPSYAEALQLHSIAGFDSQWSFTPGATPFWVGTNLYNANNIAIFYFSSATTSNTTSGNRDTFCIREAESSFTVPSMSNFTATASDASIDLAWTEATGSYSGYYIYWVENAASIDYNTPQLKLKKPATSYTITGLLPNTTYKVAIRPVWTNKSPQIDDGNTTVLTPTTNQADLDFLFFDGHQLSGDKLAVAVRVIDGSNNLLDVDGLDITLTKVSGSGTLGGTTTVATVDGIAKFTALTYNATDSLVLSADSDKTDAVNSASNTVVTTTTGACTDFTTDGKIRSDHGGCYFQDANLVISAEAPTTFTNWHALVWEDNASGTTAEASDTSDGDSDGRKDDFDGASAFTDPGTSGYCHDLVQGGKTDWRVPSIAELSALNNESPWLYSGLSTERYYLSNRSNHPSGTAGLCFYFPTGVTLDSQWRYAFCVRTP